MLTHTPAIQVRRKRGRRASLDKSSSKKLRGESDSRTATRASSEEQVSLTDVLPSESLTLDRMWWDPNPGTNVSEGQLDWPAYNWSEHSSAENDNWQLYDQRDDIADAIASIGGANFDDLPSYVLAMIASHTMSKPLAEIQEVRACHCLSTKTFPFRGGVTSFLRDTDTESDVRKDNQRCRLDRGGLAPWCLRQDLSHVPGRKHPIPAFATVNKLMYKKWRDATSYVFCAESCLAAAVGTLTEGNVRMMTHVRFFERDNKKDTIADSKEGYTTGLRGENAVLVYSNQGMTEIEYHGLKVHVKDLYLTGLTV